MYMILAWCNVPVKSDLLGSIIDRRIVKVFIIICIYYNYEAVIFKANAV